MVHPSAGHSAPPEVIAMKKSAWLPAVIAPVVVAGAIAAPTIANAASETTTAPTAASVLASVAGTKGLAYSGKVTQTSDLGLPSLPSSASGSGASSTESNASNVLDLLTSDHTARVYVDGATKARVQVLDSLAERDVVVNGSSVWTWDSKKNRAVHVTLPSRHEGTASPSPSPSTGTGTTTPADIAKQAIAAITPTTTVSEPTTTKVAGQSAWKLVLSPKSSDTLVKDVTLAIDKKTGLPLSAAIDAKGQTKPAVSVAYDSIDYGTPAARLFDFTPPKDAKVTTKDLSDRTGHHRRGTHTAPSGTAGAPATTGTGWSTIATLPAGTVDAGATGTDGTQLLNQLTKQVAGGRALETSLVSVYLTDDGRVLAGAVPVADLVAAAK
jgi:outer membrane lipoprotein-sorting protein